MQKPEIRALATPKPLNRSSPKLAYLITDVQNLVAIPQGLSFPVCAKLRIRMFTRVLLGGFSYPHSRGPRTDSHGRYVKQRGFGV